MKLLSEGKPEEAIEVFKAGITENAGDVECLIGLGRACMARQRLDQAREAFEKALAIQPDNMEANGQLARMDADQGSFAALDFLEDLSEHPEAGFFEHFNFASALVSRGEDLGAEEAFERALQHAPKNALVWYELGMISLRKGDFPRAIEQLGRAESFSPGHYTATLALAQAHATKGDVKTAIKCINRALLMAPGSRGLLQELYKYTLLSKPEDAVAVARRLRELDPTSVEYAYNVGISLLMSGQAQAAISELTAAVKQWPDAWVVKDALAKAHLLLKDEPAALALLEEVHRLAPTEPDPANDLASLYLARPDGAGRQAVVRLLEPVLREHAEHAVTHLNMALALASSEPDRALTHARKAQLTKNQDIATQALQLVREMESRAATRS